MSYILLTYVTVIRTIKQSVLNNKLLLSMHLLHECAKSKSYQVTFKCPSAMFSVFPGRNKLLQHKGIQMMVSIHMFDISLIISK